MGACICKTKVQQSVKEYVGNALLTAIEQGRAEDVQVLYHRFMRPDITPPAFDVDEKIITLQEVPLNALAYAFRAGQVEIARFLLESARSSLQKLYETYQLIGRTPLDIACEYNFLPLVQYFLPIHLKEGPKYLKQPSPHESLEELSIFAEGKGATAGVTPESTLRLTYPYQSAIHRACEHGHLEIVKFLHSQSKRKPTPIDCDISAVDDKAGENCALIAARSGSLPMVRFLHEECEADFNRLNRRGENALQVAVIGSKRKPGISFLGCVKYLVEVVGVDVTYEYEETLLICEDKTMVFYIENQLYLRGIIINKAKVDQDNSILRKRTPRQPSKKSQELDQRCRAIGPKFQLQDLFTEQISKSEEISSIPHQTDNSEMITPF